MSGKVRFRLAELEALKNNAVLERKLEITCDRLDKMLSKNNKKHQQSLEACVAKTYDLLEEAENHEKAKFDEKNEDTVKEERKLSVEKIQRNCLLSRGSSKLTTRPLTAPACVLERDRSTKPSAGKPMKARYRSAVLPFAYHPDRSKFDSKNQDLEIIGEAALKKEEFLDEYFEKYKWAFMDQSKKPQKSKKSKPKLTSINKAAMRAESDRSVRIAKRHIRKSAFLRDKVYRDTVAAVESLDITLCDSD